MENTKLTFWGFAVVIALAVGTPVFDSPPAWGENKDKNKLDSDKAGDAFGIGGGKAGAYGQRFGKGKGKSGGATKASERAVNAALDWLVRHQKNNGSWTSEYFDAACSKPPCKNTLLGPAKHRSKKDYQIGRGIEGYDMGVTALATMAFLGSGSTHKFGPHKKVVKRAIDWMVKNQYQKKGDSLDGSLGYRVDGQRAKYPEWVYCHALATIALAEAYAITKDFKLKPTVKRAVDFIVRAQNPGMGWKYGYSRPEDVVKTGKNDSAVTAWMFQALMAAKNTGPPNQGGIAVPKSAFKGALRWFDRVTGPRGKVGFNRPGSPSSVLRTQNGLYDMVPTNTAAATFCRLLSGQRSYSTQIKRGKGHMMSSLPKWNPKTSKGYRTVNFYYWYYGTNAMFQLGGSQWRKWNRVVQSVLISNQNKKKGTCQHGSWDPIGEWAIAGGRVYATAIAALTLQVYYRYGKK